jgi:hypothetical protein
MKNGLQKRIVISLLALSLLPTSVFAAALPAAAAPTVVLDGQALKFDVAPKIVNGSTLVPMRTIFEALGSSINWDPVTKIVKGVRYQAEFMYKVGDKQALINGRKVEFSGTPGRIEQNRTLVPLRMVSESFGATVNYDTKSRIITINSNRIADATNEPAASFLRYRLTMPYERQVEKTPYFLKYMEQHLQENALLFFGDSTTWGSYLGRSEALPHLVEQATGRQSINLGVPGFTATHMVPFMKYATQNITEPDVVVQVQYFWGQSSSNSGLDKLLSNPLTPSYEDALAYIRQDSGADDEYFTPSYANYTEQPADTITSRIARGKQLFYPKASLDPELNNQLEELRMWIAARPKQTFYLYIPPYQLNEAYRHTDLTAASFKAYTDQIGQLFSDLPNLRFRDFNQSDAQWQSSDFIDWIHRSKVGEKKFARQMGEWLKD